MVRRGPRRPITATPANANAPPSNKVRPWCAPSGKPAGPSGDDDDWRDEDEHRSGPRIDAPLGLIEHDVVDAEPEQSGEQQQTELAGGERRTKGASRLEAAKQQAAHEQSSQCQRARRECAASRADADERGGPENDRNQRRAERQPALTGRRWRRTPRDWSDASPERPYRVRSTSWRPLPASETIPFVIADERAHAARAGAAGYAELRRIPTRLSSRAVLSRCLPPSALVM